jgi:uncharacterized membrane protein
MIGLGAVYVLAGVFFAIIACASAADASNPKRFANAAFWGLYAASFLLGDMLGDFGNGVLVLALVALAGLTGLGVGNPITTSADERQMLARKFGNTLFAPALAIPAVTVAGSILLKGAVVNGAPLFDPAQTTLISLALGAIVALFLARALLHQKVTAALQEGRRLMDVIGWTALLPQMLAALGAIFALAGVGRIVGDLAALAIPMDNRFAAVAAYTFGMAAFTAIMGNAFAAFPVMTAGIGLPLIAMRYGGDPAIMSAIGMLSGFCGTLMTPIAANFNLVPVFVLGLKDRYAVIRVQIPTAVILLFVNTVLMYVLVFRF